LALPDIDPSIALAQAARHDVERKLLTHRQAVDQAVDQLIEPSKNERVAFIAALRRRFAALLNRRRWRLST
jgi:hypothetical protein